MTASSSPRLLPAAIVCAANQVARARREEAERMRASVSQVRDVYQMLIASSLEARRKLTGIGPRRAEIVTAGTAVFLKALELFNQRSIYYCGAGVRDGIIADLAARGVGRELAQLTRERRAVVEAMAKRYEVSMKHVRHVAFLASAFSISCSRSTACRRTQAKLSGSRRHPA